MNNTLKTHTITQLTLTCSAIILAALLVTSQPSQAYNQQSTELEGDQQTSERRGPPPEAFTACEGKQSGDTSQFQNQRGKTLTGTCEMVGGKHAGELVLRPNKQQDNKRRGPPQEAYSACEGKTAGESSQFESRRGEMRTGTCENANGKLVLRPERFNS